MYAYDLKKVWLRDGGKRVITRKSAGFFVARTNPPARSRVLEGMRRNSYIYFTRNRFRKNGKAN